MDKKKGILIKNVYYMLSYAFQVLKQTNYEEIDKEDFENIQDLFAAILAKGIAQQVKQGLYREYITKHEDLSVNRGKLNISGTIKNKLQRKQLLSCEYDELSENNIFNQILKTTAIILLGQESVKVEHRRALKKLVLYFDGVDIIDISTIQWKRLYYRRNNHSYGMLMNICYFVIEGLILTTEKGEYKMATFLNEKEMSSLYERFVLEYYKRHYPRLDPCGSYVKWNLDDESIIEFLPRMETDILLTFGDKKLIIDTKYYKSSMQTHTLHDSTKHHSGNLYQIFAYVKNEDVGNTGNVAGMLLYAKTEDNIIPASGHDYMMDGNKISVRTLDLNVDFKYLAAQLDDIADSYF